MRGIDAYRENVGAQTMPLWQIHLDLVKKIALHIQTRLPPTVELDDLLQVGLMALIESAERFDLSKNDSFEAFARIKIRGAMIDLARQSDWTPRQLPKQMRLINAARSELEQRLQRAVSDKEVLAAIDMPESTFYQILSQYEAINLSSLDQISEIEPLSIQQDETDHAIDFARKELLEIISQHIQNLSEKEQLVMSLYYVEEMNMKEIAVVLEVSESRVCQLHSAALKTLRAHMKGVQ